MTARHHRVTPLAVPILAALPVLLAACGGSAPARTPSPPPSSSGPATGAAPSAPPASPGPAAADWPAYHANAARTGTVAGLPAAGPLRVAWTRPLGAAVYGQPLVIGGTVIAATESNQVAGLSRATGRVLWRAQVASGRAVPLSDQPCGNISPLGITGTPVYDPATKLVYAVAETTGGRKVLAGIRVADGTVAWRRDIPAPDGQPAYDQQRGALALGSGRIYIPFGGHFGDCGPYRGSVVAAPASGHGPLLSYVVPTSRRAGIWAPGGPVIGPDGTVYVSAGNGAATQPPFDGSDSVIALSPKLRRTSVFAPSRWPQDNAADLDLGSMSPALLPGGQILQVGKSGLGYLLNARNLGGVGGQLADGQVCNAFGGAAVTGSTVYVPCFGTGPTAVSVAGGHIRVLWRGPASASGSPAVGGGAVWVADWDAGRLYELSPATGRVRAQVSVGSALPHFASPSLSGGLVLLGTMHGVVAVSGA
ncbi:MAG TPA: PQQ-binding-like beta-propeller repeat protein [Streptosporangiaceae bacterium]|nr:PQQ-binding-like beta-propeller repeat protein [Streptosporangiaceae bacterium]